MKIIIDRAAEDQWYFRIVARNGKVLCHSGTYTRKRNAVEAAELIRAGAARADVKVCE